MISISFLDTKSNQFRVIFSVNVSADFGDFKHQPLLQVFVCEWHNLKWMLLLDPLSVFMGRVNSI